MTTMIPILLRGAAVAATLALSIGTAHAAELERHSGGKFPIASSIVVPPGYTTYYLSGQGADVADKNAAPMTLAAYGDTETQTKSALTKIQAELGKLGLTMADVVQMHVYLAADPKLGKMDFAGLMKGYTQFYGTKDQPALPTRSAFQVAALANPGWLVEIEVTAVKK
jgi:enamine deaminase RidA (YjgF/YER057c/UK114 family)